MTYYQTLIDWFKPNKIKSRFLKFDIVEIYPFITKKLLCNAISYAQTSTTLPVDIIQLVKQARKSLLFTGGNFWVKKGENALVDVTMGSHDGVEVCELVDVELLGKL